MLWRLLRSERCRVTKVPAEADLFVVPVWPRPKNQSGWAAACDKDANRKLAEALVHMTPGTAHKHLIIIGKGQINPSGKCDDWWRSPRGLLRRAMRVAYSANHLPPGATLASEAPLTLPGTQLPWDYGPKHLTNATEADRLTPNVLSDDVPWPHLVSVPYPAVVHAARGDAGPPPWFAIPEAARPKLVSFVGGMRQGGGYAGARERLRDDCVAAGEDVCVFRTLDGLKELREKQVAKALALAQRLGLPTEGGHNRSSAMGLVDGTEDDSCETIKSLKRSAVFCLEPGGDSPYRKSIFDSILLGCIPVVFSEYTNRVAPWHWAGFRDRSRVLVDERRYRDGALDLIDYLRNIPRDEVRRMQATIARHAHALMYAVDDFPGDAVDLLLAGAHRLAKRRERHDLHAKCGGAGGLCAGH